MRFLDDDRIKAEYTVKVKRKNSGSLLSNSTGYPVLLKDPADNMENIIILYLVGAVEKEIKTVI